jgi:hypothetical protein
MENQNSTPELEQQKLEKPLSVLPNTPLMDTCQIWLSPSEKEMLIEALNETTNFSHFALTQNRETLTITCYVGGKLLFESHNR